MKRLSFKKRYDKAIMWWLRHHKDCSTQIWASHIMYKGKDCVVVKFNIQRDEDEIYFIVAPIKSTCNIGCGCGMMKTISF